jgi:hypothetical protein
LTNPTRFIGSASDELEAWDEQKQAVKTRRRRSRTEIEKPVAEYEASGVGRTASCQ